MKHIPLTQGQVALVDDEDFEYLNQWKWCVSKRSRSYYAVRKIHRNGVATTLSMHVAIMNPQTGTEIDHRDGNGLNNQRENLRPSTRVENSRNRHHFKTSKTSKYRGVYFDKKNRRWCASISPQTGQYVWLGRHATEEAAALAFDEAAKKYFGEFAALNFPEGNVP